MRIQQPSEHGRSKTSTEFNLLFKYKTTRRESKFSIHKPKPLPQCHLILRAVVLLNDGRQRRPHLPDLLRVALRPRALEPDGAQQVARDAQKVADEVDGGPRDGVGALEQPAEDAADGGAEALGDVVQQPALRARRALAVGARGAVPVLGGGDGGGGEKEDGGELHGGMSVV
jgi:hypothetical protein